MGRKAVIDRGAGRCNGCLQKDVERADHDGLALCYNCWHAARERETPYQVKCPRTGRVTPVRYRKQEAEEFALELNARGYNEWVAEPAPSWDGERLAHPGYLSRRATAITAVHPEYKG